LLVVLGHAANGFAAPDGEDLQREVQELEADHDRATAAIYTLQAGGELAATAISDAWPSLSVVGQKRAILVLRALAAEQNEAVRALAVAARAEDDAVRAEALEALRRSGVRGRSGLASLLADERVGDRAAAILAREDPDDAIPTLLQAIAERGGSDRAGLRDALVVAVDRADDPESALRAWLGRSPPPTSVASAALALSRTGRPADVLSSYIEASIPAAEDFDTRWRLLRSAGAADASEPIDRWVEAQLRDAEPWMLRAAAVDAITARGARDRARPALHDPYPRVRARAAQALCGDRTSMIERATLARKDIWPMVRAAAVRSLRSEGEALPIVIAAVDDSMSMVRAAAIDVLVGTLHDQGWESVHRRLRATNEWPQVTEAAIDYVVAHCRTDAAQSLFVVVMRAAPSQATTDDLNNAARAIEALRLLGTPDARAMIEQLRATASVPPTLKLALDAPLPDSSRCGAPTR
jgi:hypothetical protein